MRWCKCGRPPAFLCARPGKSFVLCKRCGPALRLRKLILAHGYTVSRAKEQESRV